MRTSKLNLMLSVIAVWGVTMLGAGPAAGFVCPEPITFHLSDDSGLVLDEIAPPAGTANFKDSPALSRTAGNPWKDIGEWEGPDVDSETCSGVIGDFHAWLGLRNGDDQGTNFDLRAQVLLDDVVVATRIVQCIQGLTRNPALADDIGPLSGFDGLIFGAGKISLRLAARIGTPKPPLIPTCGGHANATGLRVYYDSEARDSRFRVTFGPD